MSEGLAFMQIAEIRIISRSLFRKAAALAERSASTLKCARYDASMRFRLSSDISALRSLMRMIDPENGSFIS